MAKKKAASGKNRKSTNRPKTTANKKHSSNRDRQREPNSPQPAHSTISTDDFPIVGIGASAGGLQALQRLFEAMPPNPGVALVIIQHLDPTRKSLTPELLSRCTAMTLCEVHDSPRVRLNSIYVIPPNKYLTIANGSLELSDPDQPRGARMAVDVFLRSLAKDMRQRAVAIILSGAGADGTLGVKAIKEAGGMVIVQSPESAEHDSMPRSAIETRAADYILTPEQMPDALVRYSKHPYVRQLASTLNKGEPEESTSASGSEVFSSILALLRVRSKHDFRNYKDKTLTRRIRRRMCLKHVEDYAHYLDLLRDSPEEIDALVKDMLISVTDFFRDPEAWRVFKDLVIEPVVARKSNDDPIRVWVPGCATGEEPYTLAIMLLESLTAAKKNCPLQIFASDIDKEALEFARCGIYPASIETDVSPERLQKFFLKKDADAHYQVSKQLRESIVFAEQNLIGDPPFSRLDMLCCRNLLIYLKPETQERIISLFHFALRDDGSLFLGSAETLGRHDDLFETLNKRWRIFRRLSTARGERVELPVFQSVIRNRPDRTDVPQREQRQLKFAGLANHWLMDLFAPSAVLIDQKWNILYIAGDVENYLQHNQGVPSDNLLNKVRRGLRAKLRGAVHQAIVDQQVVSVIARIRRNSKYHEVRLTVRRIPSPEEKRELLLVLFEDLSKGAEVQPAQLMKPTRSFDGGARNATDDERLELDDHHIIRQLEEELAATKDDLQSTIEQFESSNEEFKAANEEVMSINEELQSTNEELETSKEELQSLNEELSTVNNQLAAKVEELETKHSDLENLLSATDVATICLDVEMQVRWFTPAATRVIRLQEADVGRSLSDFAQDFVDGNLNEIAVQVLKTLIPVEDEATCHDGRTYMRRVFPYRTDDHRIRGVVMTFVDITERKKTDEALRESEQQLRKLNESLDQQVRDRVAVAGVLHDITEAANEARSIDDALQAALDRIVAYNHWIVGHAWLLDEAKAELFSSRVWSTCSDETADTEQSAAFRAATEIKRVPVGSGFIGVVAETGQPKWMDDVEGFSDWLAGSAAAFGLHAAIAFPVMLQGKVVAVLEFYSDRELNRESRFMEIMPSVGIQLGHVFERKRLEREVALAGDREQRRLGQELHDGLSQQIAGISMLASSLADTLRTEENSSAQRAERLAAAVEEAKKLARNLAKGLVPVEVHPEGLRSGLEELAEQVTKDHRIKCLFEAAEPVPVTDSFTATHLYQIAKEAVHNSVKHARANHVWIRLGVANNQLLAVEDDGVGIDEASFKEGEGLRIMRHRAGLFGAQIKIQSKPTGGTIVSCTKGN